MSFQVGGGGGAHTAQRVIDGTLGNIPDADVDQLLKLAPDNRGNVRTLVEIPHHAIARSGTFGVYTHTHYRGPFYYAPFPGTDVRDIYYSTSHKYFARVKLIGPNNYQWRSTSILDALGSDAKWLGHVANQAKALTNIEDFDNTKSYYAYTSTDQNVLLLDNSTYIGGQDEDVTYEWQNIIGNVEINNPRKFFYGEGQSERFDAEHTVAGSGATGIFAFRGGEADESEFGAGFGVAFTDINDESDADLDKTIDSSDNHVFSPDPGTYDFYFFGYGSQTSDGNATIDLMKIESGTDKRKAFNRPGWSGDTAANVNLDSTYHLEHKSLRVEDGDKFYLRFSLISQYLASGFMMLEKLS